MDTIVIEGAEFTSFGRGSGNTVLLAGDEESTAQVEFINFGRGGGGGGGGKSSGDDTSTGTATRGGGGGGGSSSKTSSTKGKSSLTEGRSHLSYCNGCIFTTKYEGASFLQVNNGFVTSSDQIAREPTQIVKCDDCKCASTNPQTVIMNAEAECDPWNYIDVFEFSAGNTLNTADISVQCPDSTWFASAACDLYSMAADGTARALVADTTGLLDINVEGPIAFFQMNELGYYMDCTVVCFNPNPPRLPPSPPSKSGGKGKSASSPSPSATASPTAFEFNPRSAKSSVIKEFFETYDPFVNKFPL